MSLVHDTLVGLQQTADNLLFVMSCHRYNFCCLAHPNIQVFVTCKTHDMVGSDAWVGGREEKSRLAMLDHRRCAAHIRCHDRQS